MSSRELHWPALDSPLVPCEMFWSVPGGHKSTYCQPCSRHEELKGHWIVFGLKGAKHAPTFLMEALPSLRGWKANWAWKKNKQTKNEAQGALGCVFLGESLRVWVMSKWVLEGFQEWDQLSDNTALVPRLRQEMHSGGCLNERCA